MNFKGPHHVWEIAPPHFGNREIPTRLLRAALEELKKTLPEGTPDQELWDKAREKMQAENTMVWFGVNAVHMPDIDKLDREIAALYYDHPKDKAAELELGKRLQQLRDKVKSINNLVVDGKPITTFDDFYANGPTEMVQWLIGAVRVTEVLSASERKNFMPE